MLIEGVAFSQIVLAVHIIAVVAAFGLLVTYPLIAAGTERIDRRTVPAMLRARVILGRSLVNPGLLVVVAAGVYLASDFSQWHEFYVQWGVGVSLVIGGIEGSYVLRRLPKLAGLAERDIAASSEQEVSWSDEYLAARTRLDQANVAMALLVLITVYFMAVGT